MNAFFCNAFIKTTMVKIKDWISSYKEISNNTNTTSSH